MSHSRAARQRWILGLVAAAAGAVMLFLGISQLVEQHDLATRGVVTAGVVEDKSHGRQPVITVSFTTRDGQQVQAETHNFKDTVEVGDAIRVRYDPQHPTSFQDERWGVDYWLPLIPLAGGLFFAGLLVEIVVVGVPDWMLRRRR